MCQFKLNGGCNSAGAVVCMQCKIKESFFDKDHGKIVDIDFMDLQSKMNNSLLERITKLERSFVKDEDTSYNLDEICKRLLEAEEKISTLENQVIKNTEETILYMTFGDAMDKLLEGKKVRCDDVWTNEEAFIFVEEHPDDNRQTEVFVSGHQGVHPYQISTAELISHKWRALEDG